MRLLNFLILSLLSLTAVAAKATVTGPAIVGDVTLATPDTGDYELRVISYTEIPFRTVLHQQFDYSCGSAALATMLRFNYSYNTTEADVFKAMYSVGDQKQIQKLGFSLLDMKKYLATLGDQADGYRVSIKQFSQLDTPAIALIQVGTYKHFVVIKGVLGEHILVGDPARGLQLYSVDDFMKVWNGIAFLIHNNSGPRRAIFNSRVEWAHWTDSHPLDSALLNQPLAPFTRDLRVIYQIRPNQVISSSAIQ